MGSLFLSLAAASRGAVEAVHGSLWRVYPMKSSGPNARLQQDDGSEPFDAIGVYYIESDNDPVQFSPAPHGRSNLNGLHSGQDAMLSIRKSEGVIRLGFVVHDVDEDKWFSISAPPRDDGNGNLVYGLTKHGGL